MKILEDSELDFNIKECINSEFEAIRLYTNIKERTSNEDFKKVLEDVIKEEMIHIGQFQAMIKKYNSLEYSLYAKGEEETDKLLSEIR